MSERLTRKEFVAALKAMRIEVVVEESYHDRLNECSYVQWEFEKGFRHADGEINWNKQLERIKAIRKAHAEREKHNAAVWARDGKLDEMMHELPLPKWAIS